jgi:hypothetical protein
MVGENSVTGVAPQQLGDESGLATAWLRLDQQTFSVAFTPCVDFVHQPITPDEIELRSLFLRKRQTVARKIVDKNAVPAAIGKPFSYPIENLFHTLIVGRR